MRLILLAAAGVMLSSCVAQHQLTPQRPPQPDTVSLLSKASATASTAPYEVASASITPPLGFEERGAVRLKAERVKTRELRKWHRQMRRAAARTKTSTVGTVPNKCKGCTFNVVGGDQTNSQTGKKGTSATGEQARATATTTGKNSGPVVAGSDSTSQTDQHGATNAASTKGNNNSTAQTNTAPEAPGVGATIAGAIATPVGKVVAVVLLAGAVYGVYRLWPLLRRKSTPTTTV